MRNPTVDENSDCTSFDISVGSMCNPTVDKNGGSPSTNSIDMHNLTVDENSCSSVDDERNNFRFSPAMDNALKTNFCDNHGPGLFVFGQQRVRKSVNKSVHQSIQGEIFKLINC